VIGRKSGKTISFPVRFVLEGEKLYVLPVQARKRSITRAQERAQNPQMAQQSPTSTQGPFPTARIRT
jgi:hypothetical protein